MISLNVNALCPNKNIKIIEIDAEMYSDIANDRKKFTASSKKVAEIFETPEMKLVRQYFPENKYGREFAVTKKTPNGLYLIALNIPNIYRLYKKSWLADYVDAEIFNIAFTLHGLAHVRYSDYEHKIDAFNEGSNERAIFNLAHNLLEDSRVEYAMSMDFPECSVFFNILLSALRNVYDINQKSSVWEHEDKEKFRLRMNEINDFTRYNLIGKKADRKFVSQIIPPVLLARRGTANDCYVAAEIVVNLLRQDIFGFDKKQNILKLPNGMSVGSVTESITDDDRIFIQKQFEDTGDMEQLANKFFEKDEVEAQIENQIGGLQAGTAVAIEKKQRSSFFLDTARKRRKEIEGLRGVFQKAFTEYKDIMVKDGDLNFQRQQQAYLDSITGEEGFNFQYKKLERGLVDVVILRDVSGSTSSAKIGYAEAIVVFLSALENLEGIRTAQIDFNGQHFTNKTFDTGIETATINPFAEGGTSISGAYKEVLGYDFKGRRNIVIVLSDGDIFEPKSVIDELENRIKLQSKLIKFGIEGYSGNGYKPVTIEDIPREMLNVIIKEGLQ